MATPDWTTVPDTNLEPGDPIRSIDIIAINNHAAAMSGGATGAPEIKIMALETIATGTTIRSRVDTEVFYNDEVNHTLHSFNFTQIGTVNVYAEHRTANAISTSTLYVYRTRNGVESLITSWSTTSTSYIARNTDVSVLPGDSVRIVTSGGALASFHYARNARFRTDGSNLWPGVSVRLENDYTVV